MIIGGVIIKKVRLVFLAAIVFVMIFQVVVFAAPTGGFPDQANPSILAQDWEPMGMCNNFGQHISMYISHLKEMGNFGNASDITHEFCEHK